MSASPAFPAPASPGFPSRGTASFTANQLANSLTLTLEGVWSIHTLHLVEKPLATQIEQAQTALCCSLDAVQHLDTAGALLINETLAAAKKKGLAATAETANPLFEKLLAAAQPAEHDPPKDNSDSSSILAQLSSLGETICAQLWNVGQLISLIGEFWVSFAKACFRLRPIRWTSLVHHMEHTGLRAVPIVALLTFLIGMVVAYMGAEELARFGAQVFAVNLLEVTVMREMAVLITAIVVAGRSSSSFTAQIGSMVANEEVSAMSSMGLDPVDMLVTPRVVALIICLPMLVLIGNIMALAGGAIAIWYSIGLNPASFIVRLHDVAQFKNFFVGMVKTPFFALIIAIVGCFQGFRATGSAASVGFLTTIAVVQAIFFVIVLDALFAIFFTAIGI